MSNKTDRDMEQELAAEELRQAWEAFTAPAHHALRKIKNAVCRVLDRLTRQKIKPLRSRRPPRALCDIDEMHESSQELLGAAVEYLKNVAPGQEPIVLTVSAASLALMIQDLKEGDI